MRRLAPVLAPVLALPLLILPLAAGAEGPGAVATLALAARLHAYGLVANDPLAVVAAVRLSRGVALRGADWPHETQAAPAATAAAAPPPEAPTTLALFAPEATDVALLMAEEDPALTEMAEAAFAETPGGRIGAANAARATLEPGHQHRWEIPLAGMEQAEIGLFGDGSARFGWVVADAAGAPVCSAAPAAQPLLCVFVPAENAFYTITVEAPATAPAAYLLITG